MSEIHSANQEVIDAYIAGDSLRMLCERFGGSTATWWRLLKQHGVQTRERGTATDETRERRRQILAYLAAGESQAEVARRFEVHSSYVWRVANAAKRVSQKAA